MKCHQNQRVYTRSRSGNNLYIYNTFNKERQIFEAKNSSGSKDLKRSSWGLNIHWIMTCLTNKEFKRDREQAFSANHWTFQGLPKPVGGLEQIWRERGWKELFNDCDQLVAQTEVCLRQLGHVLHSLCPAFHPVSCCRHAQNRVDLKKNMKITWKMFISSTDYWLRWRVRSRLGVDQRLMMQVTDCSCLCELGKWHEIKTKL